jgi:hypothetical protein
MSTSIVRAACALAIGTSVFVPVATSQAAPPVPDNVRRVVSGQEIAASRVPASLAEVDGFMLGQARQGILLDAANVSSAAVGSSEFVWERSTKIVSAQLDITYSAEVAPGSDAAYGEIVEMGMITEPAPGGGRASPTTGIGMGAASMTGATRIDSQTGCSTWTNDSNKLTACREMFKPTNDGSSTRDYYAYNRWGTAEGKKQTLNTDFQVVRMDFRSHPHRSYASRVQGLSNYFPRDNTQLCNEGTSVNVTVGSMSLVIGLTNCADKSPTVNATTKEMGIIYDDGVIFGGRVKGAEFEMTVYTAQNGANPIMSDYNYAKFCKDTLLNCKTVSNAAPGW